MIEYRSNRWGLAVVGLFLVAMLYISVQVRPSILQFHATWYALPSLIAFVANCAVFYRISRIRVKVPATYWYMVFLSTLVLWSGTELLQRLSITREGALYWSTLASVGWVLAPAVLLIFTLHYTKKVSWLRNQWTSIFFGVTVLAFLYVNLTTDAFIPFTRGELQMTAWGFNSGVERYFPLFFIWFEGLYLTAIVLILQVYFHDKQRNRRYQAAIFALGLLLPCVIGSITDGLLPIFGINFYPLSMTMSTINAVVTAYAILRFGLFSFNPATIAENILQTMEEGVVVLNPSYAVDYVNTRGLELLSYLEQDIIGLPVRRIFATHYAKVKHDILDVLKHERFAHIEKVEIETSKGVKIPVSLSAARVTDESGGIRGYIVTLTDITELESSLTELEASVDKVRQQNRNLTQLSHQLEEEKASVSRQVANRTQELNRSRAQLMASINSLEMGFIMVNTKNELVIMNQAATHILTTVGKVVHPAAVATHPEQSVKEIEHTLGRTVHLEDHVKACLEKAKSSELPEISVGGFFYHMYISPIVLKQRVIGAVLIIQDITEAKVLDRSKDEFFSIASHEMRTPLTAITGYAELIKGMYADKLADKKFNQMVEGISEGGHRMTRIVNDFLNMSRLEQGRIVMDMMPVNIPLLIEQTCEELKPLADEKNITLRMVFHERPRLQAMGDRDRIKEVLINLVGNALKFSDNGSITISAELHHAVVQVRVHDHGKGIVLQNQQLLFRKFQQAGESLIARDTSNGTGLGLYISKLMIEGMGGSIFLESSAPHQGSTFSFTLPLASNTADRVS